jgi:DNA-binding NarL/FixJ family response regulator
VPGRWVAEPGGGYIMHTPLTLLLVDGHHLVREALAHRLRRAPGIDAVHAANTLQDAMHLAHSHAPHVVVCDPRTIGGDGAEAVRRLRREVRHVVVLTSSLLPDEAAALAEAGSAVLLFKGVDFPSLLEAIRAPAAR